MEYHYQVDVELDAKLFMDECSATENLWEKHIHGDLKIGYHISVSNLDVLYLSCRGFSLKTFNTYQLNLYWLYLDVWCLADQISIKWFIITAVYRSDLTTEMEFRNLFSFCASIKLVRCDSKILWDLALTLHGINTLAWHFATELCTSFDRRFSSTCLLHGYRDFVYNWEVDPYIWVWKLSTTCWF